MSISKEMLQKLLIENRISQAQIAKQFGVSRATVCRLCKKYGLKSPYHINLDEEKVVCDYKTGISAPKIAEKYNVSITPVYKILRKYNLVKNFSDCHKGQKPWNKGVPMTDEQRKKLSNVRKGKFTGKNNPNWKGGISKYSNNPKRKIFGYRKFIQSIRERDKKCLECHSTHKLHVHHIEPVRNMKDMNLLVDRNNAITLCKQCHIKTIYKEKEFEKFYRNLLEKAVNSGEV